MKKVKVAILGATGAVGREMMKILAERNFPVEELHLLASARSVGQKVEWQGQELTVELACDEAFEGMDIVLGAAENDIAERFAPAIVKSGAVFVDNSSAFRLDPNVLPKFGVLNIEPTQKQIREIFLNRIVQAKGLSKAAELLSDIMMPTPSAVMQAMELLAQGCEGEPGIGELVAVDVGGATTDVYSIADGMPEHMNTVFKGIPEPFAKRTVEGDIGMRYSIRGIVEAGGMHRVCQISGLDPKTAESYIDYLAENTEVVPGDNQELQNLDHALASLAVEEAVRRHAGTIQETYTMMGLTYVQEGKNLCKVKNIVVTGGSLIHTEQTEKIAAYALFNPSEPASLRPKTADVWVDRTYILAAMGLLSSYYPQVALRIMKKELEYHGRSE